MSYTPSRRCAARQEQRRVNREYATAAAELENLGVHVAAAAQRLRARN